MVHLSTLDQTILINESVYSMRKKKNVRRVE